ncbi:hypothetical protein V2J09_011061 [Rumex salicifolius]
MVNSLVERATSDMLIGPDWAMNIEISDMLNRDPGQAKDIVKGIKRRIGSKNSKVQFLALMMSDRHGFGSGNHLPIFLLGVLLMFKLLETIIKNCGDIVHMHVAEKNVLQEMIKIVKKKPDLQVKEKILILIDTWQEAFGGPRARYPQYYAAYQDLLRVGAVFPPRSERAAPIFTPPQSHPLSSYSQNVQNSAFSRDDAMAESSAEAEYATLSLSEMQNARGSMDVLAEMINAIDPANKGLRQEALVDLVEQCRTYKQRAVHLVNSTVDESLLCQGLALNDDLECVLAKYESVVSGASVEAEKSIPEPAAGDLVDVDTPGQHVDAGESSKQANERSNSALVQVSAAPPANGSIPTPTMDLLSGDLLGGDFYGSPTQNSLVLVPVSATQPANPEGSENNALALADMLSAGSSAPTNTNGPQPAYEYQNQHPTNPSLIYQNGMMMTPNTGLAYEQPVLPTTAWSMQNGSSLPPPPWESQASDGGPPTTIVPVSQTAGNQQPNTNQFLQMPMMMYPPHPQPMQASPMTTPVYPPQPMYGSQMAAGYGYHMAGRYGNQMAAGYGYGYGGYEPQQRLDQRMYGLSVKNESGTSTSTQPSSYLPPMKQSEGSGDDKLFGDLVDMAKIKPTNNPPAATIGGTI